MRLLVVLAMVGCRPSGHLSPVAGSCGSSTKDCSDKDDGAGVLAGASSRLLSGDQGSGADPFAPRRKKRTPEDDEFGGTDYAGYVVPSWTPPPSGHRTYPRHAQTAGLAGAIEGAITWRGALPPKRATPCGPVDVAQIADDRGVPDTVILIETVKTGRQMASDGRNATVGGTVVKRGCALLPTAQIVTPLPAAINVAGDASAARLRIVAAQQATPTRTFDLQEAGRLSFTASLGVTRIESADGTLAAAWVLGSDAPYYAITDDHGRFRIDELAAGTYDVTIWHAPLPDAGPGPIRYGEPLVEHRSVTVAGTRPARLDVAIGR